MSDPTPSEHYVKELEQFANELVEAANNYTDLPKASTLLVMKSVAQHLFRIAEDRGKADKETKRYKQALEKILDEMPLMVSLPLVVRIKEIVLEALKDN